MLRPQLSGQDHFWCRSSAPFVIVPPQFRLHFSLHRCHFSLEAEKEQYEDLLFAIGTKSTSNIVVRCGVSVSSLVSSSCPEPNPQLYAFKKVAKNASNLVIQTCKSCWPCAYVSYESPPPIGPNSPLPMLRSAGRNGLPSSKLIRCLLRRCRLWGSRPPALRRCCHRCCHLPPSPHP